jgi:hypothetical protein
VGAGEAREPDGVHVFLHRGAGDLLGGLVQAGIDDLHPGVPQGSGDDLDTAVVPVEARFGHEDPGSSCRHS